MARFLFAVLVLAAVGSNPCPESAVARAQSAEGKSADILDLGHGFESRLVPNCDQVSFALTHSPSPTGLDITIKPGLNQYPGLNIKPALKSWDLSAFGHVEARVTNTGTEPLQVALRVNNEGNWQDNPWDTESVTLQPGESGAIRTIFGFSYGHRPGFRLNPSAVVNVMLFAIKSDKPQALRVESVVAAGPPGETPPVSPDEVRTKPIRGFLFGGGVPIDLAKQVHAQGVEALSVDANTALRLAFPVSAAEQYASVRPVIGRWDLRSDLEVVVTVRNMGTTPVTPKARLESNGGVSHWFSTPGPLAPQAEARITIRFSGVGPAVVGKSGTGFSITSDAVGAVVISADHIEVPRVLSVDAIQADVPPQPELPAWLGKRPPVPGEWSKTLDDEFSGKNINTSVWNTFGENYYDKVTHWTKADLLLGSGELRIRYEKRSGFQNDDPKRNRTGYAAGFLESYGKWTQRYGYFESKMKLPTAPGLWPAFWMMPDRGGSAPQWSRQDTANGGMEFDIMEHLTRWGPHRYNIAMHYDGYQANHKSVGSDKIYVQPDKDGFITCGLLWLPGLAAFYCNGREVLRWENPRISSVPSDLMFTVPSGGWDNNALDDSQLPSDLVVKYVRVWQRKDLATPK